MLKIDCLLKDTALVEDIKKAVKYLAYDRASRGANAGFSHVYNDLRKAGIEVDLTTAAHVYANELPIHEDRFTSMANLHKMSGRAQAETIRNIVLQKPDIKEEEIGKLSPSQYVANRIASAFGDRLIEDQTTKSVMKQLQDFMLKGSERLLGDLPADVNKPAPRTAEEIIQAAIEKESQGYTDVNGNLNGIKKVFDATREELAKYSEEIFSKADDHTKQLWEEHVNSLENAAYSLLFSKAEGKQILKDALLKDYGKDTKAGRIIDWQKLAGTDTLNLQENVVKAFKDTLGEETAKRVASALKTEYEDMRGEMLRKAENILSQKEGLLDREMRPGKSEMTRLAELHDLGIFNGAHDKLLASILGVEPHDREAMQQVKEYAEQLSKLRQMLGGNDFFVPSIQRQIAHSIHDIIASTIENKTSRLKRASVINKVYQVENAAMIAGWRNITENHLSGATEYITTKANVTAKLGKELVGADKHALQNMLETWVNIAGGGREFGDAPYQVGGNQLRVEDKYNLRAMKDADWGSVKTYPKALLSAVMTGPRAGLSATDGAFKTGLYRLHFLSTMHDALVNSGNYTHEEAVKFMNDAMYGEGAYARAQEKAKDIYDKTGVKYVSQKEINITANELLHENLLQGKEVTAEMIHEAQQSAFRQAGLGMGHESNNPISKSIQSLKLKYQREELKAFNEGNYERAAKVRGWNTAVNSAILRFAASQYNWAWIKIEQSGYGLISGFHHYNQGEKIKTGYGLISRLRHTIQGEKVKDKSVSDLSENEMKKMAEEYQLGRQKMFRGAMGLALNVGVTYGLMPLIAKALHPDDEDPIQKMFDEMGDNYAAKALLLKLTPIWGLGQYYYHNLKSKKPYPGEKFDRVMEALAETSQNVLNFGENSNAAIKAAEASKEIAQGITSGNEKEREKGKAKAAQFIRNYFPHVPFYKPVKDVLQTIDYLRTGKQPMHRYPYGWLQGLYYSDVLEDILPKGTNPAISLPYVGHSDEARLEYLGIKTIEDIKKNYGTGEEADQFVSSLAGGGEKGKKAVKAYHAEIGE